LFSYLKYITDNIKPAVSRKRCRFSLWKQCKFLSTNYLSRLCPTKVIVQSNFKSSFSKNLGAFNFPGLTAILDSIYPKITVGWNFLFYDRDRFRPGVSMCILNASNEHDGSKSKQTCIFHSNTSYNKYIT